MSSYIALLRGVNVGGKNLLPMRELQAIVANAGCVEVRTYIQSGNVVFRATATQAAQLPEALSKAIGERFGFRAPVIVRQAKELQGIVEENPFLASGSRVDASALHIAFLAKAADPGRITALDAQRSPGDTFQVRQQGRRELYLHLPGGVARSKLTNAYFDAALATTSTVRNWRTVLKLLEMTMK